MKLIVQYSLCDSVSEEEIWLKNTAHWMHALFAVCARVSTAQCKMDATVFSVLFCSNRFCCSLCCPLCFFSTKFHYRTVFDLTHNSSGDLRRW